MPWIYLDLPLTVTVEGPLHVGTGYDRGLIQRTVTRNADGDVYIPASTLKGKSRNACEDLARLAGIGVCGAPRPETMCGRNGADLCLVCRIFGAPGGNLSDGRELYWEDAHLTGEWHREVAKWPAGQTMTRTQVQLSRARGMAAEDRLYTSEFAAPGLVFTGRVSGWLEATPCSADEGYYEVCLLLAGLRMVDTLGGGRSRGAGHCKIDLPDEVTIRVQGQEEPEALPLAALLEAAASVGLYTEEKGGNR